MFSPRPHQPTPSRCEVENPVHSSEMKMRFQQDKRKRDVGSSHGPEVLIFVFVTKTSCNFILLKLSLFFFLFYQFN